MGRLKAATYWKDQFAEFITVAKYCVIIISQNAKICLLFCEKRG